MQADGENNRQGGIRALIRTVVFGALVVVIVAFCNVLFTPYQSGTHTKETIRGMYMQPENSVQVVFLGASNMLSAASPMDLYDEYGVNAYNCASSIQPLLISYGLLKDMLRMHGDTLETVVIDPSTILRDTDTTNRSAWGERVIVNMQDSIVKLQTILDFTADYDDVVLAEQLVPALKYHVRWDKLTEEDFDLANDVSDTSYSHGEFIRYHANIENPETANLASEKNAQITDERDYEEDALEAMWQKRGKKYLDQIVALCEQEGLDLLFVKTPNAKWTNKSHDSLSLLAERYGVPFLDISTPAAMEECGASYATDFVDKKHPNIHGSEKITRYMGRYLIDQFGAWEPIDYSAFPTIQADLEAYRQCREDGDLLLCDNLEDYLALIDRDRYSVFVATKGDVAGADMSNEMKERLYDLGFSNLASLEGGVGYIGVSDARHVLVDERAASADDAVTVAGTYDNGTVDLDRTDATGSELVVSSTGGKGDSKAVITVNGKKRCENKAGINFTVYNRETLELIDTSCFDPAAGFARTSDRATSS